MARRALWCSTLLLAVLICTANAAPYRPSVRDITNGWKPPSAQQSSKVAVASAQEEYEGESPYSGPNAGHGYYGMAEEKEVCLNEVSRGWCDFYGDFYDWK